MCIRDRSSKPSLEKIKVYARGWLNYYGIASMKNNIDAVSYTHLKGRKDVTVFSMAMANVTGNPKRTIATILTMGLSCVLFVIISNYVGNIDPEYEARIAINHGQFELQLDYSQNYDEAYSENNLDTILQNNPLNDSLIKEIKSIPGVTDVLTREIVSADLNGTKFPVAIVNQEDFEMKMCIRDSLSTVPLRNLPW